MPTPLKDPAIRRRRNRTSTQATLTDAPVRRRVPKLPEREGHEWHPLTRAWWKDTWRSPMASEFLKADTHGLYLLADLIDRYWNDPNTALAAEIRQQRMAFGLTPIDRRRLQWTVEKVEQSTRRRPTESPTSSPDVADDPRRLLSLVQ